jgi:hypothetical protein
MAVLSLHLLEGLTDERRHLLRRELFYSTLCRPF